MKFINLFFLTLIFSFVVSLLREFPYLSIVFDWLSFVSPRMRCKVEKLLGDEHYSSEKLEALGFRTECTLKDWTET